MKFQYSVAGLIVALLVLLSACHSDSTDSTLAANGGVTGTGITMGRITNFGSVFVNGVRFDVDNARFKRNEKYSQGQSDFSVGEYVVIKGSIDKSGTQGVAMEVSYNVVLTGEMTSLPVEGTSLNILGQLVYIDSLTVFYGFSDLTDLSLGNILEVSGVIGANGHIVATHVKRVSDSFEQGVSTHILKGNISNINENNQTFDIQGTVINYGNAVLEGYDGHVIHNDQTVEVQSDYPLTNSTLAANRLRLVTESHDINSHESANIEGLISRFVSAMEFDINGIPVTTDTTTRYTNGNANTIQENVFIKLKGTIHTSGVLLAEHITFKTRQDIIVLDEEVLEVNQDANELVLAAQIVVVNASTLMVDKNNHSARSFTLADIVLGDHLKVRGITLNNGKLLASKLERLGPHRDKP